MVCYIRIILLKAPVQGWANGLQLLYDVMQRNHHNCNDIKNVPLLKKKVLRGRECGKKGGGKKGSKLKEGVEEGRDG